jgi:hypothetical protein
VQSRSGPLTKEFGFWARTGDVLYLEIDSTLRLVIREDSQMATAASYYLVVASEKRWLRVRNMQNMHIHCSPLLIRNDWPCRFEPLSKDKRVPAIISQLYENIRHDRVKSLQVMNRQQPAELSCRECDSLLLYKDICTIKMITKVSHMFSHTSQYSTPCTITTNEITPCLATRTCQ